MRYTRYNYKPPRKSSNFMIIIILTLIAAIALGTVLSKLIPKNTNANNITENKNAKKDTEVPSKEVADDSKAISKTNISEYVAIQCGAFTKKEGALEVKNSLMKFGTPFIVEEDKVNRVLFGIYPKDSIDSAIKVLQDNKIDFVKIKMELMAKDSTSAQTNEMISAHIKILNKLSEKDNSSYDTVELKKWLLSLEGAEEKSENYKDMTVIKTYLTALPAEYKKEKTEEGYIYIYKFIKKLLVI